MSEKRTNNRQFINNMMTVSIHGPMMEVFIIEAIRYYSEQILKTPEPSDETDKVINPKLWWKTAEEANNLIVARFERKES